jgi:Mg-chelatase subunit ChlD
VRFTHPQFLGLLLGAVWLWRRGTTATLSLRTLVLRVSVFALVVIALSGLQLRGHTGPIDAVFALDMSNSMPVRSGDALAQLSGLTHTMRGDDRAGLVVFGSTAALERPLRERLDVATLTSTVGPSSTDIAAALRVARSALPTQGSRRIVLVSDGLQTRGDIIAEAMKSGAAGVHIDVVSPTSRTERQTLEVTRVTAPPIARAGEPLEILITATGTPGLNGTIALDGAESVMREEIVMPPNGVIDVSFVVRPEQPGVRVFEASAEARGDDSREISRGGVVVSVSDEPRVLTVGANTDSLVALLTAARFRVERANASTLARDLSALSRYDAVVLDDVRPESLPRDQMRVIRQFVEQSGGGLIVLGGPESLEAGALTANGLGELLPVDYRPRGGQRGPSLALVVAFDKSGSMDDGVEGVPRIEFARDAVRRVLATVPATDAVGVIAFDTIPTEIARLRAGHDPRAISTGLASIRAGGPTAIAPAIELATSWLTDPALAAVTKRHILLISDGRTSAADAAQLRERVRSGAFELSTVALGDRADRSLLQTIAQSTGGRAYFPSDIRELPAIVARESARVAGGALVEEPFQPRAAAHPLLSDIDTSTLPRLGGYVVGARRPTAEIALESPLRDPILATWRFGLGRVATYSADLGGDWSRALRNWPQSRALIAQTVRWASRRVRDEALYVSFARTNDMLRLVLDAVTSDGAFLNALSPVATMRTPSGDISTINLKAVAPGRYEAAIEAAEEGPYVFTLTATDLSTGDEYRAVCGTYWTSDAERARTGVDLGLLRRVAEVSGGRMLSPGETPFNGPRPPRYVDVRSWLIGAALVAYLIERLLPSRRRRSRHRPASGVSPVSRPAA